MIIIFFFPYYTRAWFITRLKKITTARRNIVRDYY